MTPPAFTAADVRRLANVFPPEQDCHCDECDRSRALTAYAARLQGDEYDTVADGKTYETAPTREELREEGRREILAEIATLPELTEYDSEECRLCGGYQSEEGVQHEPGCLLVRAQQATTQPTTP